MNSDGTINLLCPECGNATRTPRQPYDYPEAVRLEVLCGECNRGGFDESCYYDRNDQHITRDPDETPTEVRLSDGPEA